MSDPEALAVDASGNLYIDDYYAYRIRRVDHTTHIITSIAGDGTFGYSGDGGPATKAELKEPEGVAVDAGGNIYIGDTLNHAVREVGSSTLPAPSAPSAPRNAAALPGNGRARVTWAPANSVGSGPITHYTVTA